LPFSCNQCGTTTEEEKTDVGQTEEEVAEEITTEEEETTKSRVHSEDGLWWEEKVEVANWIWVTNLAQPEDSSIGDLKNIVKVCHCRWHNENRCCRRNSKYVEW